MGTDRPGDERHAEVLRLVAERVGAEWVDDEVELGVSDHGRAVVIWRRVTYWVEDGALLALQARPDRLELAEISPDGDIQLLAVMPLGRSELN